MSYNGSGVYTLPTYLAVTGQTITATQHNTPLEDIQTALNAVILRNGVAAMTGNLAMGANKITGLATPTNDTDASTKAYVDSVAGIPADGDYGSITVSSTGTVWTIDADTVTFAMVASAAKASAANVRASAASVLVTPDSIESAAAPVALSDASTVAVDWDSGINFTVTLAGNRTLGFPTNVQPGTWRRLQVTQDGTGSRTLVFTETGYYTAAGDAPTLSTGAADVDVFYLYGRTTSIVEVYTGANDLVQVT